MVVELVDPALLALIGLAISFFVVIEFMASRAKGLVPSWIPGFSNVWDSAWNTVESIANDAEGWLLKQAGNVWHSFISNLGEVAQLAFGLTVLVGDATYLALKYLWNTSLPAYIIHKLAPLARSIDHAISSASSAEQDAQTALSRVAHVVETTIPNAIATAEADAAKLADAAKSDAISYADTAVAKLRAAEDAAVAAAVSLATTAEHDAAQAYSNATAYVDSLVKPIGGELTDFEQYVKGLGLPGALAALAALSTVVTTALAESGLDNSACRSKVSGICSTDPLAWAGLLAGLAGIGFTFSLADLAAAAEPVVRGLAGVVAEAK